MISPEEAERIAYIKGDTEKAALLAIAIYTRAALEETQDDLSEAEERITGLEMLLEAKE
jgi:hypothetical protein